MCAANEITFENLWPRGAIAAKYGMRRSFLSPPMLAQVAAQYAC